MQDAHPLQPKQWGGGSYAERFAHVRPHVAGRTVLDIGAGDIAIAARFLQVAVMKRR